MAKKSLMCWKCGATLKALPLPLSRRDECPICTVELHVCRMCRHYDEKITGKCRSDFADPPREKERANFCDYFVANAYAYKPKSTSKTDAAKEQLAELFGDTKVSQPDHSKPSVQDKLTEEEKARIELEKLFGD